MIQDKLVLLRCSQYEWGCLYVNGKLTTRMSLHNLESATELVLKYNSPIKVRYQAYRQGAFGEINNLSDIELQVFSEGELQSSYERLTSGGTPSDIAISFLKIIEGMKFHFAEAFPSESYILSKTTTLEMNHLLQAVTESLESEGYLPTLFKLYNYSKQDIKSSSTINNMKYHLYMCCSKELFYKAIKEVPSIEFNFAH